MFQKGGRSQNKAMGCDLSLCIGCPAVPSLLI